MVDLLSGLFGAMSGAGNAVADISRDERKELAARLRQQARQDFERIMQSDRQKFEGEQNKAKLKADAENTGVQIMSHESMNRLRTDTDKELTKEKIAADKATSEIRETGATKRAADRLAAMKSISDNEIANGKYDKTLKLDQATALSVQELGKERDALIKATPAETSEEIKKQNIARIAEIGTQIRQTLGIEKAAPKGDGGEVSATELLARKNNNAAQVSIPQAVPDKNLFPVGNNPTAPLDFEPSSDLLRGGGQANPVMKETSKQPSLPPEVMDVIGKYKPAGSATIEDRLGLAGKKLSTAASDAYNMAGDIKDKILNSPAMKDATLSEKLREMGYSERQILDIKAELSKKSGK